MAKHVKRSVIPIYLVGAVWLIFGLFFSLYRPADYILCALLSAAAFVIGRALFPNREYQLPGQEDADARQREREAEKKAAEAHAAREKAQREREADSRALSEALGRFLTGLGEENRRFFLRRYWYAESVREVAKTCGVSESKVKMSLHRTRKKLRAFLQEEGLWP